MIRYSWFRYWFGVFGLQAITRLMLIRYNKVTYQRNNNILQYIPRNMHTVFVLLCFVVVKHWLIFPYPSGLLHWHCGNLTIAPVPAKQPWWIWINTSCEFIMNDCITTTKQSTTKSCAYILGYSVPKEQHYSIVPGAMVELSVLEGLFCLILSIPV